MSTFSENLKSARLKKGVTQTAAAMALGMTKQSFSLYENGKREPDFEMLKKISEYFNVDIGYLVTGEAPKVDDSSLKFALFGDAEIDDKVLEDVKRLAILHMKMREEEQ